MIREASDEDFAALVAGRAPEGLSLPGGPLEDVAILQMLRTLASEIRPVFAPAAWLIVEDGEVVGLTSIVKAPDGQGVDIGYGVAPTRRGGGVAARAVGAILAWADSDARIAMVRAETSVENLPSQRVLMRNGFVEDGRRTDSEDGDLICWSRRVAL